ncbi:MAG TPA: peptide ABC transporter substrate-binding protein [Opitutaceae bacterium]|nr:peptide ABC transporter substrate-binding protein [Opitutaceae bacterium]
MTFSFPRRFALALAALLLLVAGCRRKSPAEAGIATQTLLLGNSAEPADLDPDLVSLWPDSNIDYALFEGLTWLDEKTTKPVPAAAKSWDVSPDGLVYTFHLRPNARWSNGDPVTAADFAYAFRRILTPSFAAVYSYMLWPIKNAEAYTAGKITDFSQVGIKVLDPLTLQITLAHPTPYLPALAAHTSWLPVHQSTVEKYGKFDERGTKWTRPGNLVGNGPFVLTQWIPNGRIVVEKNPQYWDAAHVRLNRIEFFPIENHDAEEADFRAGQLHVTYGLPDSSIAHYRATAPQELRSDPILSTYYLFVNVTRPPLNNAKLRRALSMAIDRNRIVRDVLYDSRLPAHAFTPPDCGGYTPRASVPDDFAAARKLLAEAGYPDGRGLPVFNVQSYQAESAVRYLEVIQAEWAKELNVHITISPLEFKTAIRNQQTRSYTMAFSGWIADYPDPSTFLNMMVTGGGNNYTGWGDPEYDRLIDETTRTADNRKRFEDFQKAEAILLDQAAVIPLYYDTQVYLIQPYVHRWLPSKVNFHRFQDVWLGR